ncbi:DUF5765 domain-containing protein [Phaeovulum sp.]|nr:DUF5765 domain-containing protein [Phaeovulum sp.]MDP1667747.1 DUF5765 domain-containing protein [Phaeovulum sp.]MDZ4118362.1 DUF5765 domain-containing protein [Phaeovulum sp.]
MCWGVEVTAGMAAIGVVAAGYTWRRGDPGVVPLTLTFFAAMEGLQFGGYLVVDQCSSPANQSFAFLSILHIIFQPFIINAFALQLVPAAVRRRAQVPVYTLCAASSVVMLMQLFPFDWAGTCTPGSILCGEAFCTISGAWHIAWNVPYNALMAPVDAALGMRWGFPTYLAVVFVVPLFYGAWRFALFHAAIGPMLASQLTPNPNEIPAIWCLFSIGIAMIAVFPQVRQLFEVRAREAVAA